MSREVNDLVMTRLKAERRNWRSDHPFGFVAKPLTKEDGTVDLLKWICEIPGPAGVTTFIVNIVRAFGTVESIHCTWTSRMTTP
jgi:ubiquitin-protein ligase